MSEYIECLKDAARECQDMASRDRYHKACLCLFKEFVEIVEERLASGTSPGDRHVLSKSFETALVHAFHELDGIVAASNPQIVWRDDTIPFRKSLDILISHKNSNRSIAVEIKGVGFDAIAGALVEFALCAKDGSLFRAYDNISDEQIERNVAKRNTMYCLLMTNYTQKDHDIFDAQLQLFNGMRVSHHGLFYFNQNSVPPYSKKDIISSARRFFKETYEFVMG